MRSWGLLLAWLLTVLIGGGLGWGLRHATEPKSGSRTTAPGAESSFSSWPARSSGNSVKNASSGSLDDPAFAAHRRIATIMNRVSTSNPDDMVDMIGGIGAMTQMTDGEVRLAWAQLSSQSPTKTFGGSLTAMYLWSRMLRMGERVIPPDGWGVEEFKTAVESENARQNMDQILARLENGGAVSETERRVALTQAVRTDPLNAVKMMCRLTKPADYQRDAQHLVDAMTRPETRAAVMAEVRKWQAEGGSVPDAVAFLARNWINRAPEEVEQWLQQPEQADIREATMNEVINARTMENASDAWAWCQSYPLSEERRRYTLGYSSQHLANERPEEGIRLIADLKNPDDRREVIGKFGPILAGGDIDQWKQWRETLSPAEQNLASESAFHVWARKDVDAAVQWLNTQPSGESKNQMVVTLISVYAGTDPHTAVDWIRTIPDAERRRKAVSEVLAHVGFEDLNRSQIILNVLPAN
jgi:hypothetical protein